MLKGSKGAGGKVGGVKDEIGKWVWACDSIPFVALQFQKLENPNMNKINKRPRNYKNKKQLSFSCA